jgi:hypothetical protein
MAKLIALLVTLFVATAFAQRSAFSMAGGNSTSCRSGTKGIDKSSAYKTGAGVATIGCGADYEDPCATPAGLVFCNKHDASCRKSDRANDADLNPSIFRTMAGDTYECVSEGAYEHPEASVLLPAQATTSFVVIVFTSILVFIRVRGRIPVAMAIIYWLLIVTCILLLISFYYLNAFVGVLISFIVLTMYATKDASAVTIGMLAAMLGLLWFTFDGGLGYYQHHSRLWTADARDPAQPFYETQCLEYYRYSYRALYETNKDNVNANIASGAVCARDWLAAEYFFVTLLKLWLAYFVAAGAGVIYSA